MLNISIIYPHVMPIWGNNYTEDSLIDRPEWSNLT
jgi:hypothetical protein